MNIILADCEELRRVKPKPGKKTNNEEEKRVLGLVLLRGDKIISISVEGPPQKEDSGAQLPKAGGLGGPGNIFDLSSSDLLFRNGTRSGSWCTNATHGRCPR